MAKKRDDTSDYETRWHPTSDDVADLKEKLRGYEQIRINGKLQSRFDQYCKTMGIIGFDEFGGVIVYQPEDYKRLSDTYWKYRSIEDAQRLSYLEKHPEERQKIMDRLKETRKSFGFV